MSNDNQAYKWLTEWVESGGIWLSGSSDGVLDLCLFVARSYSGDSVGFRDEMRKLLNAAEKGWANE